MVKEGLVSDIKRFVNPEQAMNDNELFPLPDHDSLDMHQNDDVPEK